MIAIAISLLFGFAAFAALTVISISLVRATLAARSMLAELAEIDAYNGRAVNRSGRARPAGLSLLRQQSCAVV
ncbi:hypothetical protein GCM10009127_23330 [Alteraurantiacibacter aestuarii]